MLKLLKGLVVALLTVVIVVIGALVGASLWVLYGGGGDIVASMASRALGRDVEVGDIAIHPGWTTTLTVESAAVANSDWGEAEQLASVEKATVALDIGALLRGDLALPEIDIDRPIVALERTADGRVNWSLGGPSKQDALPEQRSAIPRIDKLNVTDGRLSYRDAARALMLEGRIDTITGEAEGEDSVTVTLEGALSNEPLRIDFDGGAFDRLTETTKPFPVDLLVDFAQTELRVDGELVNPMELEAFDLALSLEGPTLSRLFPLLQIPFPETPPYTLDGRLVHEADDWSFQNFDGRVGDSDLSGTLTVDLEPATPLLRGRLASNRLDFDDLAGIIGAEPDPSETASEKQVEEAREEEEEAGFLPETNLADERLRAMDMDLRLDANEILAPNLPINALEAHLRLVDGRAELDPFDFELAGGSLEGELALNTREETPSADADIVVRELDLRPFFKDTQFIQEMGGQFYGSLYVLGVGVSLGDMAASARGEASVAMRDGSLSGLIVEGAGLDIAEALALFVGEDARVPVRCGRVDLAIEEGIIETERAFIDTADSVLLADATVNLGRERFRLQVENRAKDFSILDIAAPVVVTGTFSDPSVSIGDVEPLPFEGFDDEGFDCSSVVEKAAIKKAATPEGEASR